MAGGYPGGPIDWVKVAGDAASLVRPESRAKYFPRNPLRRLLIENFLSRLGLIVAGRPGKKILDLGCGEGFVDYYLTLHFPDRMITGVDPDPAALQAARKINPSLDYFEADARRLAFPDRAFDLVLCLEVLEHLDDYPQVMAEARRVSAGPCVFSVPAWPWYQATNFLIGKNWARLGEHPDHVVRFTKKRLGLDLEKVFGPPVELIFSYPWLIGLAGRKK